MGSSNDGEYVPQEGDIYVLAEYPGDRWTLKRHDGVAWQYLDFCTDLGEVHKHIAGMEQVGSSRNKRKYYRLPGIRSAQSHGAYLDSLYPSALRPDEWPRDENGLVDY